MDKDLNTDFDITELDEEGAVDMEAVRISNSRAPHAHNDMHYSLFIIITPIMAIFSLNVL